MTRTLRTFPRRPRAALADLHALFRGFADPIRIRILNLLVAGELCVCDIEEILGVPQSSVSRHLAYLRRVGLVVARRTGKFAHYRLTHPRNELHRRLQGCARAGFAGMPGLDTERGLASRRVAKRAVDPC